MMLSILNMIKPLFNNVKATIVGVFGALTSLYILFLKRKVKKQKETINEQDYIIHVYEKKDGIKKEDEQIDNETNKKMEEVKNEIRDKNEEEAVNIVSNHLNDYFGIK